MSAIYLRLGIPEDDSADVCAQWWRQAAHEPWGRMHPARSSSRTVPLFMHGDEGTGHKKKPVMVLSVGSPLSQGHSLDTRFPNLVMPGKLMCWKTKLEFQDFMAEGFNRCWKGLAGGYRGVYAGTRGDWKFHVQIFPEEGVSYTSELICFGCGASTTNEVACLLRIIKSLLLKCQLQIWLQLLSIDICFNCQLQNICTCQLQLQLYPIIHISVQQTARCSPLLCCKYSR